MERMREARKKMGYTMKFIAEKVGVSESAISQYETGKRQPDFETASKIADLLFVSVDYLLGREEEANDADNQSVLDQLGPNQRYIAETLPKLNEEQAKIFRALLEQMGIK